MVERIKGIVIDVRRHSDRHDIVTLFSRTRGRMACISAAGASRSARLRQARLQPLAIIEANVNFRPNNELQNLGAFDMAAITADIYFNPLKRSIAIFASDFLNRLLRASAPDAQLYDTIVGLIKHLDTTRHNIANFHIAFLATLLVPSGIFPDFSNYAPEHFFDMARGEFSALRPVSRQWLYGDDATLLTYIRNITPENCHLLAITPAQRHRLLQILLDYYATHFPGTSNLPSLDVLTDIFNS